MEGEDRMRCPECDGDNIEEFLGDCYETIYRCESCGCEFEYEINIIKSGDKDDRTLGI